MIHTAMSTAWRRLSNARSVRRIGALAGATTLAQAITILASPLLTRVYTPADFGVFAIFGALLGVGSVIVCLGYDAAIVNPEKDRDARSVLALALSFAIGSAMAGAVLVRMFGSGIVYETGIPEVEPYLWLLPLAAFLLGVHHAFLYWTIRVRNFSLIAHTRINQALAGAFVQLGLGFGMAAGPIGLILGSIMAQSVGITMIARGEVRAIRSNGYMHVNWRGLLHFANRYRRFPFFSVPAGLVNSFVLYAPAVIMAAFYGPMVAGFYALTQRVLGLPMVVLGQAISDVFLGETAKAGRSGDFVYLRTLFVRAVLVLLSVTIVLVTGLIAVAPVAFVMIFGEDWRESGNYVQALAPMYAIGFVAAPFGGVLTILERQDLFLVREIIRGVLSVGALVGAAVLGAEPIVALSVMGAGGAIGYLVYIAFTWFALHQRLRHR